MVAIVDHCNFRHSTGPLFIGYRELRGFAKGREEERKKGEKGKKMASKWRLWIEAAVEG